MSVCANQVLAALAHAPLLLSFGTKNQDSYKNPIKNNNKYNLACSLLIP